MRFSSFKRVGTSALAIAALAAFTCLAPSVARAQTTNSGTVTGQVTDAQGAAIVGAVVVLTNSATNGAQPAVTNKEGRYIFANLGPGTYTIDVKKDGFKEAVVKNETVELGKPLTINVPMQVGSATQTVEVTATGAELQTLNATVGTTVGTDAIMKLPGMGRDANTLTALQPNTAPGTNGEVAGAEMDENSYSLDGGSNSDDMDGAHTIYTAGSGSTGTGAGGLPSGVLPTPAESIQTFTVGVNNQSADVNSAAGSSVSMATKRGTDAVHGSVYEYYLGSALAANTWSNNRSAIAKTVSHQNRFGASLGGEIIPNWLGGKTYLFGDYEGRRYPNYAPYTTATPTASMRAGLIALQDGTKGSATNGDWFYVNPTGSSITATVREGTSLVNQTIAPSTCANAATCDPLGIGLNPVTTAIWNTMPAFNAPVAVPGGDGGYNTANFTGPLNESLTSNFFVERLDHDFGAKNHFTSTYHFYSLVPNYPAQVDIGGVAPGDTMGVPSSSTVRPNLPSLFTAQLTSSLTPNTTNNFTYSWLRNFWQWTGGYFQPEPMPSSLGALGGVAEYGAEGTSVSGYLQPYNVNTQATRTRFWDGIGNTFSDDVSMIHGNHVFQFGGKYTHQRDLHQRNDNGGSIDTTTVYQMDGQNLTNPYAPSSAWLPSAGANAAMSASSLGTYTQYLSEVLGTVGQSQTMYSRAGSQLSLEAQGTPLEEESEIPLYNVYFSDSWHLKPSFTMTYGAGYTVEMPPLEAEGRQIEAVDASGEQISAPQYLAATERAALGGQVYNPTIGFAEVGNIGAGLKYPYNTFYGGLSPRISVAWNPNVTGGWLGSLMGGNKTVIRGGWSRIYGRLNGVDQVLVPLLGTGLAQPIACQGPQSNGTCQGVNIVTPANAFRLGPTSTAGYNGMSVTLGAPPTTNLPQPYYPGAIQNGVVNPNAGSNDSLDPDFKPDRSDEFDLTIQRQFTPNFSTEIGYTGRIMRNEYDSTNIDSVPIMLTAGGQQFQNAFAAMAQQMMAGQAISAEPFFEAAMGGPASNFCKAFSSCTQAVAATYGPSGMYVAKVGNDTLDPVKGFDVYNLWSSLQSNASWQLGRTTMDAPTTCSTPGIGGCPTSGVISASGQVGALFQETSNGWGNYNGLFWTVSMRNYHGLTAISNFTWSRSFGLGDTDQATSSYTVTNPFDLHAMYGPQSFDYPLNYNLYFIYEPGSKTQHSFLQHVVNGWSFAPVVTWSQGWVHVSNGSPTTGGVCDAFGEGNCNFGSSVEHAVLTGSFSGFSSDVYGANNTGTIGSGADAKNGGSGINVFGSNAAAAYAEFRPLVLGLDENGAENDLPGASAWNMDFSITKDLAISERFSTELNAQATNVFNHDYVSYGSFSTSSQSSFGDASKSGTNGNRAIEVGLAVRW